VITARAAGAHRAPAVVIVIGVATVVRALVGGPAPAASVPAAILFSGVLATAVVWGGARVTPLSWRGAAMGLAGAAALVALSLLGLPAVVFGARAAASALLWWVPLVTVVAAVEELVLRGVLFDAVRSRKPVVEDVVFGHNAALACHMANESYFRKTGVYWDDASKSIKS